MHPLVPLVPLQLVRHLIQSTRPLHVSSSFVSVGNESTACIAPLNSLAAREASDAVHMSSSFVSVGNVKSTACIASLGSLAACEVSAAPEPVEESGGALGAPKLKRSESWEWQVRQNKRGGQHCAPRGTLGVWLLLSLRLLSPRLLSPGFEA